MNAEALRQLRRVVQNAPDHRFHMRAVVEETTCGTARCAIGWAIIDPWFQENTRLNQYIPTSHDSAGLPWLGWIARDVFGISTTDADKLFGGSLSCDTGPHAVSKQEVIDNIDRLLRGESPVPYACIQEQDDE